MYFLQKNKEIIQDKSIVITPKSNYFQLFIKGFFLNFINVGVLGFWIAMVVIYGAEFNMDNQKIFNFFAVVVLAYLATDIGKILLAKKLRAKLTPAMIFKMKHIMGLILVGFGIFLFAKGMMQ
jgi:threonine/homoserine/homoserine lactone efflux protein